MFYCRFCFSLYVFFLFFFFFFLPAKTQFNPYFKYGLNCVFAITIYDKVSYFFTHLEMEEPDLKGEDKVTNVLSFCRRF